MHLACGQPRRDGAPDARHPCHRPTRHAGKPAAAPASLCAGYAGVAGHSGRAAAASAGVAVRAAGHWPHVNRRADPGDRPCPVRPGARADHRHCPWRIGLGPRPPRPVCTAGWTGRHRAHGRNGRRRPGYRGAPVDYGTGPRIDQAGRYRRARRASAAGTADRWAAGALQCRGADARRPAGTRFLDHPRRAAQQAALAEPDTDAPGPGLADQHPSQPDRPCHRRHPDGDAA